MALLYLRYLLAIIFLSVAGCAPKSSILDEIKNISILDDLKNASPLEDLKKTTPLADLKESFKQIAPEKPSSRSKAREQDANTRLNEKSLQGLDPRLAKILASPSLRANEKNIKASQKAISIAESQREPLVTGTSNLGPRLSDDENLELEATGGVSVTKILRDGGAIDALTEAAKLNVQNAKLLYDQSINRQLSEVLRAELNIVNFLKTKAIYDEQVKIYNDNLPLIETAVTANVISKSEALKLQQLKIRSDERYLTAKTAADASQLVRGKYNLTEQDKFFELNTTKWSSFDVDKLTKSLSAYNLLDTQIQLIKQDIQGVEATFDPKVSLAGSATANITDFNSSIGFVGLNITLPLRDGAEKF